MQYITHAPEVLSNGTTRLLLEVLIAPSYKPGECSEQERGLQEQLNDFEASTMQVLLKSYDTQGEPILLGGIEFTSKGLSPERYKCLGGTIEVHRHTYQNNQGGRTFCPMEDRARIIENTTPYFANIVAGKYGAMSAGAVKLDLQRSMQRNLTTSYLQDLNEAVGRVALAKEQFMAYEVLTPPSKVHAILLAADAANVAMVKEGYKNVCVGAFCLMDEHGECLESFYLANAPEEGKVKFWERMDMEVARLKACMPEVPWFGISDGAADIQAWLHMHCDVVTLDFFHMSEYLHEAKQAFGASADKQQKWIAQTLHELKHNEGAAAAVLAKLKQKSQSKALSNEGLEAVVKAVGYLERNLERMEYAAVRAEEMPIGSGVIEASCKRIVKERACGSGMKWKRKGLQSVLAIRSLYLSSNRWEQFWSRCADFGY